MAVDNTTIGSVLTIPDGLLRNLEKVDEKLENIQKKARETEKEFNASFQGMNTELAAFLPNLQKIVTALSDAAKNSKTMGENMAGAVSGVNSLNGSITAAIEVINKMRTLVQTPTSGGSFMSHVSTLVDAISVRVSGMGVKFKDFKRQLLELDTAAMQKAMKAQSDAKIKLMNEQTATTLAKVNLEQSKQNRLYAQAATEAAKLARAQAQLAQAQAMAATAQERATAANERAARRATIRQYGANATSAMSYVNDPTNTGTFNQRAIAIKVLEEAIKNLNKTDKDYQKNLQDLSNRYRELKSEQDRVVSSYREMQQHHRSLMDTTGQLQRAFALMFSVSQIRGYINQIAQVRGEFELQQRSLEAILQNKTEADAIFNKTVALAVQSPFQIKDLISYTKQLAAYRIESDKLYDTTKRLADVSAGLGVDMQRLILAYGQVKAAAYLRGTEVRQFTEAGINLYGELQAYFKEVKGEAYTTAQIVDMISKRMVTFEDVDAIFKRITDQGGIFYNMQAIQAETLQGKIANLKDSIDVMLNDIGKANEGAFKGTIDAANVLIRNWETLVNVGKALLVVFMMLKTQSLITGVSIMKMATADFAAVRGMEALRLGTISLTFTLNRAKLVLLAFGKSMAAAFMTSLPILALVALGSAIYDVYDRISSHNTAVRKSNEEYHKAKSAVVDLTREYKNLATATNDAQKMQERKDNPEKDIEARRNALQKLIDLAGKEGLKLDVKVGSVKDEELDSVFNNVKEKYERFLLDIAIIQRRHSKNRQTKSWGFLSDAITEDADDYKNAVLDVIVQSDKLDAAIANVKINYKNLSDDAKKYYEIIASGRRDGESDIEYYTRMYNAMKSLNEVSVGSSYTVPEWLKETNKTLIDVGSGFKNIETQSKEFAKELDDVFGTVVANMRKRGAKPVEIRAVINRYAAEQGWDDIQRLFAYSHFKANVDFDKDKINKNIGSIKEQLDRAFANNVYTISFKLAEVDADTGYDMLDKEMQDKLNELKKLVTMRHNLEGGNYEGYNPIAQNTRINELYKDISRMGKGYKELADQIMGYDKAGKNSYKSQRDILSEQIDLIEKMASKYEELRKYKSAAESVDALKQYYAENIKYSKLDADIIDQLLGMDGGIDMAKVSAWIRKLSLQFKEQTKKMGGLAKAADIDARVEVKIDSESLDAAKREVDDAFSGLNAYTDLKKLGLSDEDIKKMFGNLPKTYEDVRKQIDETFAGKEGESWTKQREDAEKKLQEQVVKYNLDTFKELTKAYKTQLSDQLQLDAWYAEERRKIEESEELKKDPKLKAEFIQNLKKKYDKQTDLNTWNAFKETEDYIRIFENLDYSSTEAIGRVLDNLENMRESLKDLPPEQLKVIVELIEKLKREKLERNPIKGIVNALKDLKKADPEDKQHALADLGAAISYLGECVGEFNSAFGEMSTMLASFGVDVPEEISGALGGLSQAFEGAGEFATAYATKDPIGMLTSGMKTLSGLGNTVANVFGFGNKDKKLQKQIEEQEKAVQRLQRAYEKLEESISNAFTAQDLNTNTHEAIENLRKQNADIERMIALENDKKDSDSGQIEEWYNQIQDNREEIERLLRQQTEEMGGFGDKANYKSAAQEFADAWMDAFNESSNTLEALQDKMDDYFDNLLKKQLMQRAAGKYFEAVFKAFDDAVAEGSAGGANGLEVTREELDKIKEIAATQSGLFDEYAKGLMEILGVSPTSSSTLSQLQQGIQSLSESTGQALESLLNSIRFFVAQQSTDVAAIRQMIAASNNIGANTVDNSPMLRELQTQTSYLSKMYSLWSSVIKTGGHPKNGAGIKVFQD